MCTNTRTYQEINYGAFLSKDTGTDQGAHDLCDTGTYQESYSDSYQGASLVNRGFAVVMLGLHLLGANF
jgi:hypothetical protein